MDIIRIDSTPSTNSWISERRRELKSPTLVYAISQTAGRGQRGNSWESEPGANITASLFFTPKDFEASRQFILSETIALAITEFLESLDVKAMVKWPNDIYAGNKKICGILVEHSVMGRNISHTIAGFGINVNQTRFLSDAPNPVSVSMLTGKEYDIQSLLNRLAVYLQKYLSKLDNQEDIHSEFLKLLWRKDNKFHHFYDKKTDEPLLAKIESVGTDGILTLSTPEGQKRCFAFKEVEFVV